MPCIAKKAFNVAQTGNIRLIVQVKDNQPTLKQAIHHIAAIIQVERAIATRNPETGLLKLAHDTTFYVANTSLTAAIVAKAIRAHWGIENSSHYVRDVTFAEDRSRIRTNPGVIARLRSFAFNIMMNNKATVSTLSQDRYRAALAGLKHLLALIT